MLVASNKALIFICYLPWWMVAILAFSRPPGQWPFPEKKMAGLNPTICFACLQERWIPAGAGNQR
jgi:hypothetical protein